MRVDAVLNETIAMDKTKRKAAELLNVSPSIIDRYQKAVGTTSNRKPVETPTEEKQALMLKSIKTKAINKLIKDEMEKIKLLFADEQVSKAKEF